MGQTKCLLTASVPLFRKVFAGCCQSLLTDGPSRRYLLNLCIGAWTPTPPRSTGAFTRFFPVNISLTFAATSSARETTAIIAISMANLFRSCNHSFMFRLPYLLAPPIAPTADTFFSSPWLKLSLTQFVVPKYLLWFHLNHHVPGQSGRLHHAMDVWLLYTNCGIATYLNRAIDTTGLSPVRLRPYRPLPATTCSTVFCAYSAFGSLPIHKPR